MLVHRDLPNEDSVEAATITLLNGTPNYLVSLDAGLNLETLYGYATAATASTMALRSATGRLNAASLGIGTDILTSAGVAQTINFPDSGKVSADVILSEQKQTINGAKTFTSTLNGAAGIFSGNLSALNLSGINTGDISLGAIGAVPSPAGASLAGQVLTLQPADGTFGGVLTAGAQTIAGNKTFSGTIAASNISGTNTGDVTLGVIGAIPSPAGASLAGQVLSLQPADGTFGGVLTAGAQTIAGNKTFSGTIAASNISGTNTGDVTLGVIGSVPSSAGASLAGQVLTLQPADGTFGGVLTAGTQTLSGAKTLSSALTISATSNQLTLGSSTFPFNATTLTASSPAVPQTITIRDCGSASSSFILADATGSSQTINDILKLNGVVNFKRTTNQMTLGSGNIITINSPAPVASLLYTLPDAGANASFVMTQGTQTISGLTKFQLGSYPTIILNNSTASTVGIDYQTSSTTKFQTFWDPTNGFQLVDNVAGTIPIKILPSSAGIVLQQNDITLAPTSLVTVLKPVSVTDTTDSSSSTTGAIRTGGGMSCAKSLNVGNDINLTTGFVVDTGFGVAGREANAGKIGYAKFSAASLDIVGAGTLGANRSIKFWNEGGATFSGGILLPTSGGTASSLSHYEETTQSLTWVGAFSANQAFTLTCTRVGRMVTIMCPSIIAASGSAAAISLLANQVARFRPAYDVFFKCRVHNSSAWQEGLVGVYNGGNIIVYASVAGGNFSGTANCGVDSMSLSYSV